EENKLYTHEMGATGLSFTFSVEAYGFSPDLLEEALFIVAGFRAVTAIGAMRKRGKGVCSFEVKEADIYPEGYEDLTEAFLQAFKTTLRGEEIEWTVANKQRPQTTRASNLRHYLVLLQTVEPAIISRDSSGNNVYIGMNYVPGQTLRGALASAVAQTNDLKDLDTYKRFIDCFVTGKVRFTNCYPTTQDVSSEHEKVEPTLQRAAIPIPSSWRFCEVDSTHPLVRVESQDSAHAALYCERCRSQSEPVHAKVKARDGYVTPEGALCEISADQAEAHIQMEYGKNRAKRGMLFEYVCLPRGVQLVGALDMEPSHAEAMRELLAHCADDIEDDGTIKLTLRIGKGYTRGYGKTSVRLIPIQEDEASVIFHHRTGNGIGSGNPVSMLFLSDTILLDRFGRYIQSMDAETLSEILGVEVNRIRLQLIRTTEIRGFNAYLGLPRWTDIAIRKGSVILFDLSESSADRERLLEIERQGVGIRRNEGYGMVAFNHPIMELASVTRADDSKSHQEETLGSMIERWARNEQDELSNVARRLRSDKKHRDTAMAILRILWTQRFGSGNGQDWEHHLTKLIEQHSVRADDTAVQPSESSRSPDDDGKDLEDFRMELGTRIRELAKMTRTLSSSAQIRVRGRALEILLNGLQSLLEDETSD
ncbi:MAG: hypothetical protein ACP6IT_11155, partial [Candidatus Thorarchaeota archaeon]